ncbi:hypothetical protein HPTD01_191 [Halomonas sp. TD01]|nr:hypothetical protein GME_05785 [Halomonas sp. TD01]CAH1041713.1 hypothetical protein HPTD01_191 [Halomonas sp. TD01]
MENADGNTQTLSLISLGTPSDHAGEEPQAKQHVCEFYASGQSSSYEVHAANNTEIELSQSFQPESG